jgi:hypothetical protein
MGGLVPPSLKPWFCAFHICDWIWVYFSASLAGLSSSALSEEGRELSSASESSAGVEAGLCLL